MRRIAPQQYCIATHKGQADFSRSRQPFENVWACGGDAGAGKKEAARRRPGVKGGNAQGGHMRRLAPHSNKIHCAAKKRKVAGEKSLERNH